ncbi:MAG: DUF3261 domain-containing protein [Candidatus Omnitrophota bacterium]
MRRLSGIFAVCFLLFCGGCAHLPARSVSPEETQMFLDNFTSKMSHKYETLGLVVFKYWFFSLPSLGMTSVDLDRDYLAVAGVTPVGITLFRVVSLQGKITQSFVVPELARRGDVAKVVAGNIRDIYFEWAPKEPFVAQSRGEKIYLKTLVQDGLEKEYIFSENDRTLLEKRLYKKGKLFWKISYDGWSADADGKIHPKSIRFQHRAYRYQLLINSKEVKPL